MTTGPILDETPSNLEEQLLLEQAKAGNGIPTHVGADMPLRVAPRLVANYGGSIEDRDKMTTTRCLIINGASVQVHWYRNSKTNRDVEFKFKREYPKTAPRNQSSFLTMKIRCIANTGASLPDNYLDLKRGYTKELKLPLTIGKEYVVYAIYERQEQVWYYIADDNFMYYPMRNPAPLFEVVDNRISQYWRFDLMPNGLLRLAFSNWLNDP